MDSGFRCILFMGMVHQPRVLGPCLHEQHVQLPPLSLNWQFCRGQSEVMGWAGANVVFRHGVS
jgi:hypothetical protein